MKWKAYCPSVVGGVHAAYVKVRRKDIVVVSGGNVRFVESFSLETGEQLDRFTFSDKDGSAIFDYLEKLIRRIFP